MRKIEKLVMVGIFSLLVGCRSKKTAKAPEPRVQNAFTEYVDRGVTAMNKAQEVTGQSNVQTQQLNAQAQAAADAQ